MERGTVLTTRFLSQGYQKTKLVATLKKFYGRHHDLVNLYNVAVSRIVSDVFANDEPLVDFQNSGHTLLSTFPSFRPVGMVGEACLLSNAYYPRTPDYTLYSGVHVCGLNILILHSFSDLWVWIMAWVPWPQLLYSRFLIEHMFSRIRVPNTLLKKLPKLNPV